MRLTDEMYFRGYHGMNYKKIKPKKIYEEVAEAIQDMI